MVLLFSLTTGSASTPVNDNAHVCAVVPSGLRGRFPSVRMAADVEHLCGISPPLPANLLLTATTCSPYTLYFPSAGRCRRISLNPLRRTCGGGVHAVPLPPAGCFTAPATTRCAVLNFHPVGLHAADGMRCEHKRGTELAAAPLRQMANWADAGGGLRCCALPTTLARGAAAALLRADALFWNGCCRGAALAFSALPPVLLAGVCCRSCLPSLRGIAAIIAVAALCLSVRCAFIQHLIPTLPHSAGSSLFKKKKNVTARVCAGGLPLCAARRRYRVHALV